ncbi:protein unc-93 homolog A-like [Lingula anatina]|uniref:Protein unc-93 homolog A-like n=1 Tax=Lingula anatina TaxID=7574 RepID=A0A1S3H2J5_LINAN|nr:protein unc-93 homolog A-like [Lingula anatina]|eukprot:XP_013379701.2 protein unc-93 homolog A-like [Lingula anatina]
MLGSQSGARQPSRTPVVQLLFLSMTYMLGFSPFTALLNLERILNPEIGYYALMGNYGGAVFSFVTAPVIGRLLGAKGSILLGWIGQLVFIVVHFYVKAYIIIPVAFCVGILHAQTMITSSVFVTTFALQYSEITKKSQNTVMGMFNGVFFAMFAFDSVWSNLVSSLITKKSQNTVMGMFNGVFFAMFAFDSVWSNLISSLILSKPVENYFNGTGLPNPLNLSQLCGPAFCPWEDTSGTYIRQPEQYIVYILLGCFLAMSGTAFLITLFFIKMFTHPAETPCN